MRYFGKKVKGKISRRDAEPQTQKKNMKPTDYNLRDMERSHYDKHRYDLGDCTGTERTGSY